MIKRRLDFHTWYSLDFDTWSLFQIDFHFWKLYSPLNEFNIFERIYSCKTSTFSNNRPFIFQKQVKHVFLVFFGSKHLNFLSKYLHTLEAFLQDISSRNLFTFLTLSRKSLKLAHYPRFLNQWKKKCNYVALFCTFQTNLSFDYQTTKTALLWR